MTTKIESMRQQPSLHTGGEDVAVDHAKQVGLGHAGRKAHFLRHLLEMTIAMMVGMAAGGAVLGAILGPMGITLRDARAGFPELFLLGMAFSMIVPMVAWMRHRGHGWRSSGEMAAAMVIPAIPLICLLLLDVIASGLACALYCGSMIPAMVVAMLYRRSEYTGHLAPAPTAMYFVRYFDFSRSPEK